MPRLTIFERIRIVNRFNELPYNTKNKYAIISQNAENKYGIFISARAISDLIKNGYPRIIIHVLLHVLSWSKILHVIEW